MMGGWMTESWGQEAVKAAADTTLAEQVKALQRKDPAARNAWAEFVAGNSLNGTKDPNRYTPDILQQFLKVYSEQYQGKPVVGMPVADPNSTANLPECTKLLQKSSRNIKTAWAQYCAVHGNGTNDPLRHEPSFHVGFYDCLAKNVVIEGGKGGGKGGGMGGGMNDLARMASLAFSSMGGPPAKKMRTDSGMAAMTSSGDAVKDRLVQAIKAYQKSGEQAKEMWGAFADQYLGGTRDPSRHETESLQTFCQMYSVNTDVVSGGGFPVGMAAKAPEDPAKAPLVNLIKAYQKSGAEQKEAWGQFAGLTRDPMRHTIEKLTEFCQLYSLGA